MPRKTFTKGPPFRILIHHPRPDLPVPVSGPHQPIPGIHNHTHCRRHACRLPERRRVFIPSPPSAITAGTKAGPEGLREFPVPEAALEAGPDLAVSAGDGADKGARLRLTEGVWAELERRRAAGVDGGAEGDLEDAGAAPCAGEFGEGPAAVGAVVVRGGGSEEVVDELGAVVAGGGGVVLVEEAGVWDGAGDAGFVEAVLAHAVPMVGHLVPGCCGAQLLAVGVKLVATWRHDGEALKAAIHLIFILLVASLIHGLSLSLCLSTTCSTFFL